MEKFAVVELNCQLQFARKHLWLNDSLVWLEKVIFAT